MMENETNNTTYFDNVLIKLKRVYSKEETVAALSKKLSEVEIELGKSKAYIHELEDEKYKKIKEVSNKISKECKLDELYLMRSEENKKLKAEVKKLQKVNKELINKNCLLENKLINLYKS